MGDECHETGDEARWVGAQGIGLAVDPLCDVMYVDDHEMHAAVGATDDQTASKIAIYTKTPTNVGDTIVDFVGGHDSSWFSI